MKHSFGYPRLIKCLFPILLLTIWSGYASAGFAQQRSSSNSGKNWQEVTHGSRIWTGSAGLRWYNYYEPTLQGFEENSNTELTIEFRHFWMRSEHIGWGLQGTSQLYMSGFFGNLGLGNIGVGPLVRGYLWRSKQWRLYLQGGGLLGYDLALADGLGANSGQGLRYRLQLRGGLTYRLSNAIGIYWELGPDTEAGNNLQFGSRAFRLTVGIQLFRF